MKLLMNLHDKQKGFTLIELLVVISIISLLSTIVLASLASAKEKAQIAAGQTFENTLLQSLGSKALGSWAMSEGSGTVIQDVLGSQTGSAIGTTWTQGINGRTALGFNGSTSYVQVPVSSFISGFENAITISAWVKLNAAGSNWTPISTKEGAGGRSWWFGFFPGSTSMIHWSNNGGTMSSNDLSCIIPDALNTWRHIAVSYKSGVGRKMYVDGKLICQDPTVTGQLPITPTVNILIGGGSYQPINGIMQNFRVYADAI